MSAYKEAIVHIGMPVYNGARFIGEALRSLCEQSFDQWSLLIADNASTDATESICREFAGRDARISYIRHSVNIGAPRNFKFVLDHAGAEYFMWAAADDVWGANFVESCLFRLERDSSLAMAFTGLDVIDSYSQIIRRCNEIPRYSGASNALTIARYVLSPEFQGKANLIYSLFRMKACRAAYDRYPFGSEWGGDMCFNLSALACGGVDIEDRVGFFKRDARVSDVFGSPVPIVEPIGSLAQSCSLDLFPEYRKNSLRSVRGTRFYPLVAGLMGFREWRLQRNRLV